LLALGIIYSGSLFLQSNYSGNLDYISNCGKEGDLISSWDEETPDACCSGLEAFSSEMSTRLSIGSGCYETGLLKESLISICLRIGDEQCGEGEDICNSPEDCSSGENSDFESIEVFCNKGYLSFCDVTIEGVEGLRKLWAFVPDFDC